MIKLPKDQLKLAYEEAFNDKIIEFKNSAQRYTDKDFLAEGGFKKLYRIYDTWTERVVVKAYPKSDSPEVIESFSNEVNVLSSLQHPNILPLYDVGEENDVPYMVIKYVNGLSLKEFLKEKHSFEEKIQIFIKVCEAVAYAHHKNISHMDLKPENIKISKYGDVTVCDWGSSNKSQNDNIPLKMTPGYMAPEAFTGQISEKCDVFSLGCIFYEIITSSNPFKNKEYSKVVELNRAANIDFSKIRNPSLRIICQKALEKKCEDRLGQIEDLVKMLQLFLANFPVSNDENGFFRKLYLFTIRKPILVSSLLAFSLLLSTFISLTVYIIKENKLREENLVKQIHQEELNKNRLQKTLDSKFLKQAKVFFKNFDYDNTLLLLDSIQTNVPGLVELKAKLALVHLDKQKAQELLRKINKNEMYSLFFELLPETTELKSYKGEELYVLYRELRLNDLIDRNYFITGILRNESIPHKSKNKFLNLLVGKFDNASVILLKPNLSIKILGDSQDFPVHLLKWTGLKSLDLSDSKKFPIWKKLNQMIKLQTLEYLDLRNTGFIEINYLNPLNLKHIILPNAKITDLHSLKDLPLEIVDLSHSQVKKILGLTKIPTLKQVILAKPLPKCPGYNALSKAGKVKILHK